MFHVHRRSCVYSCKILFFFQGWWLSPIFSPAIREWSKSVVLGKSCNKFYFSDSIALLWCHLDSLCSSSANCSLCYRHALPPSRSRNLCFGRLGNWAQNLVGCHLGGLLPMHCCGVVEMFSSRFCDAMQISEQCSFMFGFVVYKSCAENDRRPTDYWILTVFYWVVTGLTG